MQVPSTSTSLLRLCALPVVWLISYDKSSSESSCVSPRWPWIFDLYCPKPNINITVLLKAYDVLGSTGRKQDRITKFDAGDREAWKGISVIRMVLWVGWHCGCERSIARREDRLARWSKQFYLSRTANFASFLIKVALWSPVSSGSVTQLCRSSGDKAYYIPGSVGTKQDRITEAYYIINYKMLEGIQVVFWRLK